MTKDDVTKDDVTKDDVTKDDVTKGDVTKDDATKDDVTKDDATNDDVTPENVVEFPDDGGQETDEADDDELDAIAALFEKPEPKGLWRRLVVPIAIVAFVLASSGVALWTYLSMHRADQQINDDVAAQVVKAATDGTTAMLSYAPKTMDKDFANAKAHLTGDFLKYYTQFTNDIVTPAVKQKDVRTSAAVVQAGLSSLQPSSGEVLLFVNQVTTSKENPDGAYAASAVKVGMTKIGNDWLIESFDPV
jgi:Mce-associated membrane protein